MGITAAGIGSGLDINGIINSLVAAKRTEFQPRLILQKSIEAKISAYGGLKSQVDTFLEKNKALQGLVTDTFAVKNSNTGVATATASETAIGYYDVNITNLSRGQKIKSDAYATSAEPVGEGTLTIDFGRVSADKTAFNVDPAKTQLNISIAAGETLADVRDKINAAGAGVQAQIVNDETGARLIISGTDQNADGAFRISVADVDGNNTDKAGLSNLAYDPVGTKNQATVTEAQNSKIIVNGQEYTSNSRNFTNIDGGLNITARGIGSTQIDVTDQADTEKVSTALKEFVDEYNKLVGKLKAAQDKENILDTESSPRFIERGLRSTINKLISGNGLASVGLELEKDGKLKLDETKLKDILGNDANAVSKLFADQMVSSDPRVKVIAFDKNTVNGTYAINVSQAYDSGTGAAVKGTFAGGAVELGSGAILTSRSGDSKGLRIEVEEGVTGDLGTITFSRGLSTELEGYLKGLSEEGGILKSRTSNLNKQSDRIDAEKTRFDESLVRTEASFRKQFTALDIALSKGQQLQQYVTQQLSALQFNRFF